jgi:hypothetical protein
LAEALEGLIKKFNEENHKQEVPLQKLIAELPSDVQEKLNVKPLQKTP